MRLTVYGGGDVRICGTSAALLFLIIASPKSVKKVPKAISTPFKNLKTPLKSSIMKQMAVQMPSKKLSRGPMLPLPVLIHNSRSNSRKKAMLNGTMANEARNVKIRGSNDEPSSKEKDVYVNE